MYRNDPNGMEWDDEAKKQIDGINSRIDKRIGQIDKQIDKVSKSDKDANGNAVYNEAEQEQVDELNSQKDNMIAAKSEIKQMGDDKDHVYSLNARKGIVHGFISADPKNLKNITITFIKGDFGNQLHEIKHGFQVTEKSMTMNADGTASPTAGTLLAGQALEAQGYQRQLSASGSVDFNLWPQEGEHAYNINQAAGNTNTVNQINTSLKATKLSDINVGLIPRLMTGPTGNTRTYPEYTP